MKIFLIITDYGSFNNFLSELAVELSILNYEVHVITSEENIIKVIDKFNYEDFSIFFHKVSLPRYSNPFKIFKSAYEIRRLINKFEPNIVHAHFTTGIFPTILFKVKNVNYLGSFHGLGMNSVKGLKRLMFTLIESFCFFRLDHVFLVNNKDYNLVKEKYPKKAIKYTSFGFGCNIDKFNLENFSESFQKQLKDNLKIENKFVLIFTGRFVEFKGFDLVYHIFDRLVKDYPTEFKLILVGGKDSIHSTGLSLGEYENFINHKSVIHVGYSSEVESYLSVSNLLLFPSRKEGLPTCIIEALSMGLPVITLNERGNSDVIIDSFNGFLFDEIKKEKLICEVVEKIVLLKNDNKVYSTISKNSITNRYMYSRKIFISEQINYFKKFSNNE